MCRWMNEIIQYYKKMYSNFGYSPKSLGWDKGKQNIRFYSLTKNFNLENMRILDFGCGFGDFNHYMKLLNLSNYYYTGIDITDEFITEAKIRYENENVKFYTADILNFESNEKFDYVISSGVFNHALIDSYSGGGYEFIFDVMKKAFSMASNAIAFDFLSDRVDYTLEHTFHSSPVKILDMAYSLSRNVLLDNTFFPFEFTIVIYKNDTFRKETTIFNNIESDVSWLGL